MVLQGREAVRRPEGLAVGFQPCVWAPTPAPGDTAVTATYRTIDRTGCGNSSQREQPSWPSRSLKRRRVRRESGGAHRCAAPAQQGWGSWWLSQRRRTEWRGCGSSSCGLRGGMPARVRQRRRAGCVKCFCRPRAWRRHGAAGLMAASMHYSSLWEPTKESVGGHKEEGQLHDDFREHQRAEPGGQPHHLPSGAGEVAGEVVAPGVHQARWMLPCCHYVCICRLALRSAGHPTNQRRRKRADQVSTCLRHNPAPKGTAGAVLASPAGPCMYQSTRPARLEAPAGTMMPGRLQGRGASERGGRRRDGSGRTIGDAACGYVAA